MAEEPLENVHYKVVVLGDSGVGKTALMVRYAFGKFNPEAVATVGIDVLTKKVRWQDQDLKLRIWDTVGQEKYASLTKKYCRDADAAIFCYDITRQHSFVNIRKWLHDYSIPEDCFMVLVGCKTDLQNEKIISTEEGQSLAKDLGVQFFETSAMSDSSNVDDIFTFVIENLVHKEPKCTKIKDTLNLSQGSQQASTSKGSCKC